jgi:hypothetical protein
MVSGKNLLQRRWHFPFFVHSIIESGKLLKKENNSGKQQQRNPIEQLERRGGQNEII